MKKYILLLVLSAISLTGFAQFANEGTVYTSERKRTTNGNSFVLGVRAGMPFLQVYDDEMRESFHFGLLTEFRLRNSWWLSTGLLFTKTYIYEDFYKDIDHYYSSETSYGNIEANFYNLRLPLMLQYKWEGKPFSYQLHAGGFIEYSIFDDGSYSYTYQEQQSETITIHTATTEPLYLTPLLSCGFNFGGGLSFHSFYLGVDMEVLMPTGGYCKYYYGWDWGRNYFDLFDFGLLFKVSLGYDIPIK